MPKIELDYDEMLAIVRALAFQTGNDSQTVEHYREIIAKEDDESGVLVRGVARCEGYISRYEAIRKKIEANL
jgi:hypothetical protein